MQPLRSGCGLNSIPLTFNSVNTLLTNVDTRSDYYYWETAQGTKLNSAFFNWVDSYSWYLRNKLAKEVGLNYLPLYQIREKHYNK